MSETIKKILINTLLFFSILTTGCSTNITGDQIQKAAEDAVVNISEDASKKAGEDNSRIVRGDRRKRRKYYK
ncbi:hypothetical protein [Bacillus sp. SM2101]|uniref:hypothetical protein n=1 Tax=Bacillus sp. SM2101 TaxID=2805366 RepID=UPI001BDE5846|nr:hypothetical protein [Bacillus sp. SM2101]